MFFSYNSQISSANMAMYWTTNQGYFEEQNLMETI